MIIRPAHDEDIPEIVSLLKLSLGEGLMPKSDGYWKWKHLDNPFGKSPVLLALDNSKIVGVRAFMRWRWRAGDEMIEAVRAVDTVTHPDYQGKGIFKKLTLALLEYCAQNQCHFVYNTPNAKSKPGYLKMGWTEAGKLPIHIKLINPLQILLNVTQKSSAQPPSALVDDSITYFLNHPGLENLVRKRGNTLGIATDHNISTLRWRYGTVPVATYFAAGIEQGSSLKALAFYRLKETRLGKELRITDIFEESPGALSGLKELIASKIKIHKPDFMTLSGLSTSIPWSGLFSINKVKSGPTVTIRNISAHNFNSLKKFERWRPSIGDLELF